MDDTITTKISEELTSGSNLAKALASCVVILVTEHDLVRQKKQVLSS